MKINIYGVGRSGTKAVQLYLSYLLAKKYGTVKINYEPFLMRTRHLGDLTKEGMYLHKELPFFIHDDFSNKRLADFLIRMSEGDHITTKFIRACGRSTAINRIMKPDYTIIIVRDLYGVLQSIANETWNMETNWDKFLNEASEIYPNLNDYKVTSNKMILHAIYWYAMNKYMLEHTEVSNSTFILRYEEIKKLADIFKNILPTKNLAVDDPMFMGNNIHTNFPLTSINNKENPQLYTLPQNRILKYLYKLAKKEYIIKDDIGNVCEVSNEKPLVEKENKPKFIFEKYPLFEEFREEINELLIKSNA